MESVAVFLYPMVAIISVIAYLPQIKLLIFAQSPPEQLATSSWLMWWLSSAISLFYGLLHMNDTMFCIVSGLTLALVSATIVLILYNKYFRFRPLTTFVEDIAESISEATPDSFVEVAEAITDAFPDIIPEAMMTETIADAIPAENTHYHA